MPDHTTLMYQREVQHLRAIRDRQARELSEANVIISDQQITIEALEERLKELDPQVVEVSEDEFFEDLDAKEQAIIGADFSLVSDDVAIEYADEMPDLKTPEGLKEFVEGPITVRKTPIKKDKPSA